MTKKEQGVKKFFDFIFNDDTYIETDKENKLINIDFNNLSAKRDAVLNMGLLKKVLNLYFVHNNVAETDFKINVITKDEE